MSKKKTTTTKKTTTKTDADQPAVLPLRKGSPAKKKGHAQPHAAPATTPTRAETPAPQASDAGPRQAPASAAALTATPPATETPTPADAPPEEAAQPKKTKKQPKPKKVSCLDAAAQVLADAGTAMTTGEMIEVMGKKGLWSSPNGQTPAATLYAAILREINTKGAASRFTKTERGKFAAKA
jgi:HB1, ASXL, restriction endonuclease HTH domain